MGKYKWVTTEEKILKELKKEDKEKVRKAHVGKDFKKMTKAEKDDLLEKVATELGFL